MTIINTIIHKIIRTFTSFIARAHTVNINQLALTRTNSIINITIFNRSIWCLLTWNATPAITNTVLGAFIALLSSQVEIIILRIVFWHTNTGRLNSVKVLRANTIIILQSFIPHKIRINLTCSTSFLITFLTWLRTTIISSSFVKRELG